MMTLSELARALHKAKQDEKAAKSDRIEIEETIADQVVVPGNAPKGSHTVDVGDGLKITVTRKMLYKADVPAMRSIVEIVGRAPLPLKYVPAAYAFDPLAYEKLRVSDPAFAEQLAEFVTVTPAKVAVTLKLS